MSKNCGAEDTIGCVCGMCEKPNPTNNSSIREEILSIVHLCACQCMNTDNLGKVERLEKLTVKELETLITIHTDQILDELESKLPKEKTSKPLYDFTNGQQVGWNNCLKEVKQTIKLYRGKSNE